MLVFQSLSCQRWNFSRSLGCVFERAYTRTCALHNLSLSWAKMYTHRKTCTCLCFQRSQNDEAKRRTQTWQQWAAIFPGPCRSHDFTSCLHGRRDALVTMAISVSTVSSLREATRQQEQTHGLSVESRPACKFLQGPSELQAESPRPAKAFSFPRPMSLQAASGTAVPHRIC